MNSTQESPLKYLILWFSNLAPIRIMPGIKKKKITNARSNLEQFNQNILGASPVYQYVLKTSLAVITNHVD